MKENDQISFFIVVYSNEYSTGKQTSLVNEQRRSRLNSPAEDEEELLNKFPSDPDYGESLHLYILCNWLEHKLRNILSQGLITVK